MTDFELILAPIEQKTVLENLMHLYLYDFTEFDGADVDSQGRFTYQHLPLYWTEVGRYPFLITVAGKAAGFVLVRKISEVDESPVTYSIAEFFIMKKYRRKKIGQRVACSVFDRFPGRWEVAQIPENLPAQHFWRGVIGEYTGGRYQEIFNTDFNGPMQIFETSHPGGESTGE